MSLDDRSGGRHPTDRLPDYIGGGLSEQERAAVEGHLANCPPCRTELELLDALRSGPAARLEPAEAERLYTPLPRRRRGDWTVGVWRAAAGVVIVLTSYGIWLTTRAGNGGGETWSADDALAGWDSDLVELRPGVLDLRVALGGNGDPVWPELASDDLVEVDAPADLWEDQER